MSDSDELDALDEKHERNREQRVERVRRWARYIKTTPVEEWGPQHKRLVDSQLQAAREADLSADHYRRVERVGSELRRERDDSDPS